MFPTPQYNNNAYQHQHQQNVPPPPPPAPLVDTVIIGLPQGFSNWFQLPVNPLIGQKGIVVEGRGRSDYNFYCDACQKGFMSEDMYNKHVNDHLYCQVPGCNFTCRKDKSWKMDMHVETLHSRIDAPNLADSKKYVEDRKRKFPTKDIIEAKTEELMLKASRGEILPDERRRWLRRYGVVVRRDGQGVMLLEGEKKEHSSKKIDDENKTEEEKAKEEEELRKKIQREREAKERREARLKKIAIALTQQQHGNSSTSSTMMTMAPIQNQDSSSQNNNNNNNSSSSSHHRTIALSESSRHIIPMGANGRLTKTQQVQLVRDKYRAATKVPNFYVCNRCGLKGVHWIEDCPKTLELQANAKERRMRREREQEEAEEKLSNRQGSDSTAAKTDQQEEDEQTKDEEAEQEQQESSSISNIVIPEIRLDDLPNIASGLSGSDNDDEDESDDSDDSSDSDSDSTNSNGELAGAAKVEEDAATETQKLPKGTRIDESTSIIGTTKTTVRNQDADILQREQKDQDRPLTEEEEIQRRRLIARRRLRDQMKVESNQRQSAKPSLLDRMMEDSKLASSGLLLQAMRFFVANNFFEEDDNTANTEEEQDEVVDDAQEENEQS